MFFLLLTYLKFLPLIEIDYKVIKKRKKGKKIEKNIKVITNEDH